MLWLCLRLPHLATSARTARGALSELERLAAWAYQWSSQVCCREPGEAPDRDMAAALWLEIEASAALFGEPLTLMNRLSAGLNDFGYGAETGLAPSIEGAALLARGTARPLTLQAQAAHTSSGHPPAPGGGRIAPPASDAEDINLAGQAVALNIPALRSRLASLPLHLLDLPQATIAALTDTGLRRIGELLALPAAAIARRFGPDTSLYLRRLTAQAPDPRASWRLPPFYRTRCEFDFEIHDTTALRFPLQRLLDQLQGYLRAMDRSVQQFTLRLEHPRHAPTPLTIGLGSPGRDASQFALLLRERLDATALPAPVCALELTVLQLTAPAVAQSDFFGTDAQRGQQLQQVLDRLHARLGDDSVQGLVLQADYRPEHAWCLIPARPVHGRIGTPAPYGGGTGTPAASSSPVLNTPARPAWLLPAPQRIEPPPSLLGGPERIESGWWDGADCARDYYLARSERGQRLWVFRDLRTGHWYLHGLWA